MVNPATAALHDTHPPGTRHRLEASALHVHYGGICALHNVSFRFSCGECVGLLGPNGAGKSTLLKTIAGMGLEHSGTLTWNGAPLAACRGETAYLPQSNHTDPNFPLTVRGLVEMGRYPHLGELRSWRPYDSAVVADAIDLLELRPLQHRRLHQLSGGQRQRANLARAIAQEAHVLLLDEPFSGLDEPGQRMLIELLRKLASGGRLLLVSHHDMKTVPALFDQVLMLKRHLIACGPTEQTFTDANRLATFGDDLYA